MLGIDNLTVEFLKGYEVPILDGSGYQFYKALKVLTYEQSAEAKGLEIREGFEIKNCKAYIKAEPSEGFCAIKSSSLCLIGSSFDLIPSGL